MTAFADFVPLGLASPCNAPEVYRSLLNAVRCSLSSSSTKSAASWDNPRVDGLASTPGVMRTELDQCEFGLMSEDEIGRALAKKPTSLLTSSVEVNRKMSVKCRGGHRHVHLMAGRARAAAHYPAKFCKALFQGMTRQARVDAGGMMSTLILATGRGEIGEVTHTPEP